MPERIEIVKDQASQRIWFKALEGRPSATPSVGIKDQNGTVIVTSGTTAVTQDTVNTTLSAIAAKGDKEISLTSVAGLRLEAEYRLTNLDGQYETVRIKSLTNAVQLYEPLERAYGATATDHTFQSLEWYYTLQAADVDVLDELYVATSSYAVTGAIVTPVRQTFDVVLYPLINPLEGRIIKDEHPDIAALEWDPQKGQDYRRQIKRAFKRVVRRIYQHSNERESWRPAAIVSSEDLALWALAEFKLLLEKGGISVIRDVDKETALTMLEAELNMERTLALGTIKFFDPDQDESNNGPAPLEMDMVR